MKIIKGVIVGLILFLGFVYCSLNAELLLIERDADGTIVPAISISRPDSLSRSGALYDIICKYKWPQCLSMVNKEGVFSPEEREELKELFSNAPGAEENFIRRKVKRIKDTFDVLFVPTVIYELFCISNYMFDDDSFKRVRNTNDGNSAKIYYGGKELFFHFRPDFLYKIPNDFKTEGKTAEKAKQEILDEYQQYNRSEDVQAAFFAINERLVRYLSDKNVIGANGFLDIKVTADIFDVTKEEKIYEILLNLVESIFEIFDKTSSSAYRMAMKEYFKKDFEKLRVKNVRETILFKELALEYEAREKNRALLFRGMSPVESVGLSVASSPDSPHEISRGPLLDLSINAPRSESEYEGTVRVKYRERGGRLAQGSDKSDRFFLRSISYGNSLFAGVINDETACAYYYFDSASVGYGLLIDKERYVYGDLSKLFFVSPFSVIVGLFAFGEFFHSRSRVCDKVAVTVSERIGGLAGNEIFDYPRLLRSVGDPMVHVARIAGYLNRDNVKLLSREERYGVLPPDADVLLANEARAAKLYLMLYFTDKWLRVQHGAFSFSALRDRVFSLCKEFVGGTKVASDIVHEPNFNVVSVPQFLSYVKVAFNTLRGNLKPELWLNRVMPKVKKEKRGKIELNIISQPYVQKLVVKDKSKVFFFGDIHGSCHSLLRGLERLRVLGYMDDKFILRNPEKPDAKPENKDVYVVFTGDYQNLGRYGVETLHTLLRLYSRNPGNVILLRGDHENLGIIAGFGFKNELIAKYGQTVANEILSGLNILFEYLPEALFLGCKGNFVQCCHGGVEPRYNPSALLESSSAIKFEAFDQPNFITGLGGTGNSFGFTQSYFGQFIQGSVFAGKLIARPGQPDGYQLDTKALEKFLARPEYKNVKGFIRGHQHSFYGCKMAPKCTEPSINGEGVRVPPNETAQLVWWKRVVQEYLKLHPERVYGFITNEGVRISDFAPVFTFSSAPEGASYVPGSTLDYDCFGILTVRENYEDWRLIPYEISLLKDRNNKTVTCRESTTWHVGDGLITYENGKIKVHDCINVMWDGVPVDTSDVSDVRTGEVRVVGLDAGGATDYASREVLINEIDKKLQTTVNQEEVKDIEKKLQQLFSKIPTSEIGNVMGKKSAGDHKYYQTVGKQETDSQQPVVSKGGHKKDEMLLQQIQQIFISPQSQGKGKSQIDTN